MFKTLVLVIFWKLKRKKAEFFHLIFQRLLSRVWIYPPEKWKYVPLQDFTSASDIDWAKSIPEIDRQLYAKYGLDAAEIEFIETHVKEMS